VGVRNLRAICPNCGAKIHTQPKGLGHITWANSWINVQTGKECPSCGVALTGKVKANNRAELANGPVAPQPQVQLAAGPEGWYPDPVGRYQTRYFDGINWTWRVANDDGVTTIDPRGALAS